jgi:hypothetical protein
MPERTPIGTPTRLVKPMRIRVPWIAGPMPPPEVVWVRKAMLSWGAPRITTSVRMLIKGTIAITTHIAQRTKNRRFLNLRKP